LFLGDWTFAERCSFVLFMTMLRVKRAWNC
jgi:hypothetical protein